MQLRKADGTVLIDLGVPQTGGYQSWTSAWTAITINAGAQTLRVHSVNGGWNFNWMNIASGNNIPQHTVTATPTSTPQPTGGSTNFYEGFNNGQMSGLLKWLDRDDSAWNLNNNRLNMKRYPGNGFYGNARVPVLYYPGVQLKNGMSATEKV